MKKVMLSAAALMIGSFAFAQVTVSQSGTAPTSALVPNLSGDAGANTGLSVQNGDDNRVRVRQAGTSQSAYTVQNNGAGSGGNLARVRQTGEVNPGVSGIENATDVFQSGTANQSTTRQEGDYNNAVTKQGQNDGTSADNKALIRQGVADQAESNFAAIEQDGDANQATIWQTFDNSDAWTQQLGDNNKSMIVQDAGPNATDGHEAMNYQRGNNNETSISQEGDGGRNTAYAETFGDDNQTKQIQRTTAVSGETGNYAAMYQGSYNPDGGIGGPEEAGGSGTLLATALVDNYFIGGTDFVSTDGEALQVQDGKGNELYAFQYGGPSFASNYLEQVQDGEDNLGAILQNRGGGADSGGDNYAKQEQVGDRNIAGLAQNFSSNKAYQDQLGDDNTAYSTQIGNSNVMNIHQRGDMNYGTTGQRGDGNAALLTQWDGQSYSIEQGLAPGAPAFGNQADILQVGPDGNFGDSFIDCDFDEPVDLDMDYTVPAFGLGDICPDC